LPSSSMRVGLSWGREWGQKSNSNWRLSVHGDVASDHDGPHGIAPLTTTKRWVLERTNSSWSNAHEKILWCTQREGRVIELWIAFCDVILVVRRLIRERWRRYRWESRPLRRT
jgi:hypothetical protein